MPFMVIYSTSDGTSCHEQADAIDEAALFVERLRNKEGIEEIRIYRMEEISFAFRPYYKVELGMPERQATAPPPEVVGTIAPPSADESPSTDRPRPRSMSPSTPRSHCRRRGASAADANSRRGLFGR